MSTAREHTPQPAYALVCIGVSAGGLSALTTILPHLPADYPLAIIVVQHLHPESELYQVQVLSESCKVRITEADEKEPIEAGTVYLAPPNYHLLVEKDRTLSLSTEEKVCFSRPSIDVLLETAADAYGPSLVGLVLTGASRDGSQGLRCVRDRGGLTVVQDPATAEVPTMPAAAVQAVQPDHILPLDQIGPFLAKLADPPQSRSTSCNNP